MEIYKSSIINSNSFKTQDSYSRSSELYGKLQNMEINADSYIEQKNKEYYNLKDKINNFEKKYRESRLINQEYINNKSNKIDNLEKNIHYLLNEEKERRKNIERKLVSFLEDKFGSIINELKNEKMKKDNELEIFHEEFNCKLNHIDKNLKYSKAIESENDEEINKEINEKIEEISNLLINEKNTKDQSNNSIFEILKNIIKQIKNEVENEKIEREKSYGNLLTIIEETCKKMEAMSE